LAVLAAVLVAVVAVIQVNRHGNLGMPFFYDEMWRVTFIRAGNPIPLMLDHDTPVPLGWVEGMRLATFALPYRPSVFRAFAYLPLLGAVAVSALTLRRIDPAGTAPRHRFGNDSLPTGTEADLGRGASISPLAWAAPPALLAALPALTGYYYFTNYLFEVLYLSLMAWAMVSLGRSRRALTGLCGLVALSPLFVVGGLFAVPGFVAAAAWWAWHLDRRAAARRRALAEIALGTAVGAIVAALVYLLLYRPMTEKPSISSWWIAFGSTFGGTLSFGGLVAKALTQGRDALVPLPVLVAGGWGLVLVTVVVIASAVTGLVVIGRREPWLIIVPLSAQILTIPAGLATGWPITFERVNLCFEWLFYLVIAAGFVHLVLAAVAAVVGTNRFVPMAVAVVAAVVLALVFPAPMVNDPHDFARGLPDDLRVVAASPAARNLVLAYHPMTWFYPHDQLVNSIHDDRSFEILHDGPDRPELYRPVDGLVAEHHLRPGDRLWCVKPVQLAADFTRACTVAGSDHLRLLVDQETPDSTIIGFEVT
jgi:hypothetical protein